jgi:hypothetical protein
VAEITCFSEGCDAEDALQVYRWINVNVYQESTGRGPAMM